MGELIGVAGCAPRALACISMRAPCCCVFPRGHGSSEDTLIPETGERGFRKLSSALAADIADGPNRPLCRHDAVARCVCASVAGVITRMG